MKCALRCETWVGRNAQGPPLKPTALRRRAFVLRAAESSVRQRLDGSGVGMRRRPARCLAVSSDAAGQRGRGHHPRKGRHPAGPSRGTRCRDRACRTDLVLRRDRLRPSASGAGTSMNGTGPRRTRRTLPTSVPRSSPSERLDFVAREGTVWPSASSIRPGSSDLRSAPTTRPRSHGEGDPRRTGPGSARHGLRFRGRAGCCRSPPACDVQPEAVGERFIAVAGPALSLGDVARILSKHLGEQADRISPSLLDAPSTAQENASRRDASSAKAHRLLDWSPRPADEAILASAQSILRLGFAT